ncbi:MAG TPA: FAD-dependent oxidoreductase [Candidatus Acidoferrales bacterium]|jgi:glycerol-3-phosphate dehydrogenase|nr:FAD-dependent oxidoreductase [Candidatus Acidoferrales bacterium]
MNRDEFLVRLRERHEPWDLVVIGGGATGVGVAVDAASRGYDVALVEQHDFGKGTSSRSTKLVHGGVRYLEQGNISLVMEALHERGILRENAPHLVRDLAFVVPNYEWWEAPFYGIGLRLYDVLAGKYGFGKSRNLSREETLERLPTIRTEGLRGGVVYYDGQFDDSRLLIHMVWTAMEQGATPVNYCRAESFQMDGGVVAGLVARDMESGEQFVLKARVVINATGAFSDGMRSVADPAAAPMIAPSQGAHIVLDRSFLPGESAIMVPHTTDGRVMFAIPWHQHTLVGTTDAPVAEVTLEPRPLAEEIDFILENASRYLHHPPRREDVLSAFAGIRPLVKSGGGTTAALSRDHSIHIDSNGLLTIAGGKWTTYRHMAEDCVNQAAILGSLPERECVTRRLRLHGFHEDSARFGALWVYGSDAPAIVDLAMGKRLHPALPYTEAEVIWAVRHEMARTVEDVLARRTRALLLNARAAMQMAPRVAEILARELRRDTSGQLTEFLAMAEGYLPLLA